ncbi:3-methyl-2-oxobutanoate hydroxymethyltransferase [bacterium]|nr:3-methyl-2-oxobutanoate hydroxymethyltransferase [bacterium]
MSQEKTTPEVLRRKKEKGEKITALTAYDYPTALCLNEAGIDIILVGDSLGMVVLGYPNTLKVTMENMLDHCRAVARGNSRALLVADMPFLSCTVSIADAVRNAGRMIQDGEMEAVKVEGGTDMARTVTAIVRAGIPVMGHIGFTPQQTLRYGRKRVRGRDRPSVEKLLGDAAAVEEAGAFAIVLECLTEAAAKEIAEKLSIPTIGIGSGVHCDGQILVTTDMLGFYEAASFKHVKRYADLAGLMKTAFKEYIREVQEGKFPGKEHSFQ